VVDIVFVGYIAEHIVDSPHSDTLHSSPVS